MPLNIWSWLTRFLKYTFSARRFKEADPGAAIFTMDDNVRLSLAADWGSGLTAAMAVAKCMAEDEPHYTLHAGDIYHVGADEEVVEKCLPAEGVKPGSPGYLEKESGAVWPLGTEGSFAVPGNHEYDSMGEGFYERLLPYLANAGQSNEASYFCLENAHWRIIGLDTGVKTIRFGPLKLLLKIPFMKQFFRLLSKAPLIGKPIEKVAGGPGTSLPDEIVDWLRDELALEQSQKGLVFVSHHQYFTALDKRGDQVELGRQLAEIIGDRKVLWFWGHEHRLVAYEEQSRPQAPGFVVHARGVGNGGTHPDPVVDLQSDPKLCRRLFEYNVRYLDNRELTKLEMKVHLGGFLLPFGGDVPVGYNGFARLRLEGPTLHVEYRTLQKPADLPGLFSYEREDSYTWPGSEPVFSETFAVADGGNVERMPDGERVFLNRDSDDFLTPEKLLAFKPS